MSSNARFSFKKDFSFKWELSSLMKGSLLEAAGSSETSDKSIRHCPRMWWLMRCQCGQNSNSRWQWVCSLSLPLALALTLERMITSSVLFDCTSVMSESKTWHQTQILSHCR